MCLASAPQHTPYKVSPHEPPLLLLLSITPCRCCDNRCFRPLPARHFRIHQCSVPLWDDVHYSTTLFFQHHRDSMNFRCVSRLDYFDVASPAPIHSHPNCRPEEDCAPSRKHSPPWRPKDLNPIRRPVSLACAQCAASEP
ncbi:uncharacterized protein CC84DRAFT_202049 [Paraphaeosphaeria sporulosa]|uniref:Uncharacterized protein n=1 Tax=Paraphaeosphaeria sporulosa TaxID=1460663 RepID=A0A177C334_9PLEO|nr:uncharacterized protein CC84DRAFT_202049 [Paraphaeosphaeria sporulosa]OAG01581.1 hypothetical protein CC84DRAFT_202049 [Paraphaeosphaeria sporulosa]